MNKIFSNSKLWFYFLIAISLAALLGEIINDRLWMHDLEVYYRTAERALAGEQLYRIESDGHYVYKYSPPFAVLFIPIVAVPFTAAKILHWVILTLLVAFTLHLLYRMTTGDEASDAKKKNKVLLLAFVTIVVHVHREWHLGQVNLVLLTMYVLAIWAVLENRQRMTGFLLAGSLFIKPFALIFYPYLVLRGKYKAILFSVLFLLLLGILPVIFYPTVEAFGNLYAAWFKELYIEMSAKQNLLAGGNHTIFSVVARFTPVQYLLQTGMAIKVYQLVLLAFIGLYVFLFIQMGKKSDRRAIADLALLTALIPLFAFTSQNAFIFTLPCLVLLLFNYSDLPTAGKVMVVAGCILIGINIRDLMGSGLYRYLEHISVYTFGTILFLVALTMLRYRECVQKRAEKPVGQTIRHA